MGNWWRSATVIRYAVSIFSSAIATKLALDATQTDNLTTWISAGVMGLITFGPPAWNLIFRPSNAAMDAAVEADKIMEGKETKKVVKTPTGQPDVVVMKAPNVGHS